MQRLRRVLVFLVMFTVMWAPTVGADPTRVGLSPGAVVASSELPADLWLPGTGSAYRMTYLTTDRGGITPSTGMLFVPPGLPPPGGWPVIAWAHGTVGDSDADAPSVTGVDKASSDYVSGLLQSGYAVAATDYVGMGTPGVPPYLDGKVAGRSVIDSVRAAREIDADLSPTWMAVGLSQGGQAAVFAAHAATTYAPELDYRGAVANGVPSNIEVVSAWAGPSFPPQGLEGLTLFMSYVIAGLRDAYPELDVDSYLTPLGKQLVDAGPEVPLEQFHTMTQNVSVAQMLSRSIDTPELQSALREYLEVPVSGYDRPLMIAQGLTDTVVPIPLTELLVFEMRVAGTDLDYRVYPGGHVDSMYQGESDQAAFIARLIHETAPTG
ncbi:lipase [Rhodococcus sp. WMMA185]|uniref:lipase family protein n=1 Tax=Rhodococcus sp. WMMA185 TaxID=679318 RepID=UPI000877F484|nr:lipase family protein [Rhodococcus sp. WMMA185]AOW93350.1 lipase [Rhodococcus sp. WMMA185]